MKWDQKFIKFSSKNSGLREYKDSMQYYPKGLNGERLQMTLQRADTAWISNIHRVSEHSSRPSTPFVFVKVEEVTCLSKGKPLFALAIPI